MTEDDHMKHITKITKYYPIQEQHEEFLFPKEYKVLYI